MFRCSELHSHLLSKFRNQHTLPREGAVRQKKKVTVKILSLLSREQAKSWDVEEGEEEIGKVEKDGKGRFSRVLECAKATGKTPQDSQCLFEIKDSHKFSTLFS